MFENGNARSMEFVCDTHPLVDDIRPSGGRELLVDVLSVNAVNSDGLLIGVVMCALGLLLFTGGVRSFLTAATVYRNEAIPVRNVPKSDGLVEFDGRAQPSPELGTFEAPFSGEDALYCDVWMEMKDTRRKDVDGAEVLESKEPATAKNTTTTWGLAERDGIRRPFVVQEGGGRVAVDPTDADLDIGTHMGEPVRTVGEGETLPEDVRERLEALEGTDVDFDCDRETWDREDETVKYREVRLEPGDPVHVSNGAVESTSEEWGSAVDATVAAPESGDRFLISEGSESCVLRKQSIQFVTGIVVGGGIFALGLYTIGILG